MKDNNFLKILKDAGVKTVEDFPETGFIDTGSYMLNALVSGSIFGGFADNRVTGLAGSEGTGKTFFALSTVKEFLNRHENGAVVYFDSEFSLERNMLAKRGIDIDRVALIQPETLQQFRTLSIGILNGLAKEPPRPVMMVVDSLGNLSTTKELEDSTAGKETRDMTKSQIGRSIFRILTQKLGKQGVPLIATNHTYDVIGAYHPTKEMSGGGGLKYAASSIVYLSTKKDSEEEGEGDNKKKHVVGQLITATMAKSRYSKRDQKVVLRLDFDTGLDRHYGLIDLSIKHGIITKAGAWLTLPDGSKQYRGALEDNPTRFFTPDLLTRLDGFAKEEYSLGSGDTADEVEAEKELEEAAG